MQAPNSPTKNGGIIMTASSTCPGLLAYINDFVHSAYGATLEDGYAAISLSSFLEVVLGAGRSLPGAAAGP